MYPISFAELTQSSLVYRLGYGPFKAESGVRFPGEEDFNFSELTFELFPIDYCYHFNN